MALCCFPGWCTSGMHHAVSRERLCRKRVKQTLCLIWLLAEHPWESLWMGEARTRALLSCCLEGWSLGDWAALVLLGPKSDPDTLGFSSCFLASCIWKESSLKMDKASCWSVLQMQLWHKFSGETHTGMGRKGAFQIKELCTQEKQVSCWLGKLTCLPLYCVRRNYF